MILLVLLALGIAAFLTWALAAGALRPKPVCTSPFEIVLSEWMEPSTILVGNLSAYLREERLAMSLRRPTDFVKITSVG